MSIVLGGMAATFAYSFKRISMDQVSGMGFGLKTLGPQGGGSRRSGLSFEWKYLFCTFPPAFWSLSRRSGPLQGPIGLFAAAVAHSSSALAPMWFVSPAHGARTTSVFWIVYFCLDSMI